MKRSFLIFAFLLTVLARWGAARDIALLGPAGGDVRSLAVHPARPDTFFLGTADGQIFVSADSGASWQKLTPGLARRDLVVDNLAFDPRDANTLYAATWELKSDKGWLFRTEDGGKSWESISLGPYQSTARAVAIAPSNPKVIAVGISEGVILSRDRGKTWDRITRGYRSLYNVESLVFDPLDPATLYVGTFRLGWKTTDSGKKWEAIHNGMMFDSDLFSILVHPENPHLLYASACTGVYKSTNAGARWNKLTNGLPRQARRTRTLHLNPSHPETLYAGTTEGLFVSRNGGSGWHRLLADVVVNAVVVHPGNPRIILAGTDNAGVLRSEDGGQRFSPSNEGFIHRRIAALASDPHHPERYYASVRYDGQHGGFFFSPDQGRSWQSFNQGLQDSVPDIRTILAARKTRRVYAGTLSGLFRSVPAQESWQLVGSTRNLNVLDLAFADRTEEELFLATQGGLFQLDLAADKLQELRLPREADPINTVFYDPDSNLLYVGTGSGIFRSEDGGRSWSRKSRGLPDSPVNVLEKNGRRLFCGTRGGLFSSDDAGETWSPGSGVSALDIVAIKANRTAPQQMIAADALVGQLLWSEDGGNSWSAWNPGNSYSTITGLVFAASGEILAATASEGVYLISPASPSSSRRSRSETP